MNNIKLVLTDIDGVWTDGGMYYFENGDEAKKFNVVDGGGVALLNSVNLEMGIITGENVEIVKRRARKLKINLVHVGVRNKLSLIEDLCNERGITLDEVAYIGDEINDIPVLRKVGFSACPISAKDYIKSEVDFVCSLKGGEGVFREFVECILNRMDSFDYALAKYLDSITS